MNDTTRREIEKGWLGRQPGPDPQELPEADYEGDDPTIEAGRVTDAMVESVMNDLLAGQVALIRSLKADVLREDYMRAMRNMTRSALVKALAL